jgi:hypothetical protein
MGMFDLSPRGDRLRSELRTMDDRAGRVDVAPDSRRTHARPAAAERARILSSSFVVVFQLSNGDALV